VEVGSFFKKPSYPIWVVCSESHYSVLFGLDRDIVGTANGQFDLYYYDGLANQQEEIRLTIDARKGTCAVPSDLEPPVNEVIRTRWKDAKIDWNETEPIL